MPLPKHESAFAGPIGLRSYVLTFSSPTDLANVRKRYMYILPPCTLVIDWMPHTTSPGTRRLSQRQNMETTHLPMEA